MEFLENLLAPESGGGAALSRCPHLPSAEVLASAGEGEGNAAGAASSIRRKTLLSFLKT